MAKTHRRPTNDEAARAIHARSARALRPFVKVDCAAVPKELFESEFFGHRKGSFTGSSSDRKGRFELAGGGTLFLYEIGALDPDCQQKLLTAVDEKRFFPVGATAPVGVDVRIIAATSADLGRMMAEGTFKRDLYYRLEKLHHTITPLRERPEDIPALAAHVVAKVSAGLGAAAAAAPSPAGNDAGLLRVYTETDTLRDIEERAALAVIEALLRRYGNLKAVARSLKTDRGNLSRKLTLLRARHSASVATAAVFSV